MQHYDIRKFDLEFKNLLSGPAPIGRILNYIYIANTEGLFHKNGNRYTDLRENIGYAWTTEFMIGLGLLVHGENVGKKTRLIPTKNGTLLYNLIKDGFVKFDESTQPNNLKNIKQRIMSYKNNLYSEMKNIFMHSIPYYILKEYLQDNGYFYLHKEDFQDDFFEKIKNMYDTNPTPYNRNAKTPTARNRVPSLLQLCEIFDLLITDGTYSFSKKEFENDSNETYKLFPKHVLKEESEKYNLILKNITELVEKYGEDGTVLIEAIVRNSSLQKLFKHNLFMLQNKKCILCGMENPELLVASHIRPAVVSNVQEKVDYNNGLLLCCNHDKLFDRYLITFNFIDGQIELSKKLSSNDINKLQLDPNFKLPKNLLTPERQSYLMQHNVIFKQKEEDR